jgi:hypothetical protein
MVKYKDNIIKLLEKNVSFGLDISYKLRDLVLLPLENYFTCIII